MNWILLFCIVLYGIVSYTIGNIVVRRWFTISKETLFEIASSILLGILITVPITYAISCLVYWSNEKIIFGVIISIVLGLCCVIYNKQIQSSRVQTRCKRLSLHDLILIAITASISVWIMWKTIHVGVDGTIYVARNTVFDIAHALSVIRSFSWGNNIPFFSPFANGFQETYHFFFYFLVACLERFSVPLVVALNVLSSLGFALYLIMGYYIPQLIFQQKRWVGWITVILLLTHSTLTWLFALQMFGLRIQSGISLWRISNYLFAGPYDGSVISLFYTLNVFVNQRHLAIGIAMSVWILIAAIMQLRKKSAEKTSLFILGVLTGLMIFWNVILCWAVIFIMVIYILLWKRYTYVWTIICGFIIPICIFFLPYIRLSIASVGSSPTLIQGTSMNIGSVILQQLEYWVNNLGFGIIAFVIGFCVIFPRHKKEIIPYIAVFITLCVGIKLERYDITQKVLTLWNVWFVVIEAIGVYWLWSKRSILRWLAIPLLFLLIASGCIDMMVIKNDYQYPAIPPSLQKTVYAISHLVPQNAVVISYKEMYHPVALAGRQQYYGFFASPQADYRMMITKEIFGSTSTVEIEKTIQGTPITHIFLSKQPISDFPYTINFDLYRSLFPIVYEDERFLIIQVK